MEMKTTKKIIISLFIVLLVAQVIIIGKYAFTDNIRFIDNDMGMGFYHCQEMLKNGTIDIQNWTNTTTMEIDTSFIFAIPIYYLTGDFAKSIGVSNLFIVFIFSIVVYGILSEMKVDIVYKLLAIILFITPYSIGMLDYFNMLFLGLSCYSIKALIPLCMIWLLLLFREKGKTYKYGLLVFYIFILFLTSMSSGIYAILTGIAPILICMIIDIWQSGSLKGKFNMQQYLIVGISLITAVIGLAIFNNIYTEASRSGSLLNMIELFWDNTLSYIEGWFLLFGAVPSGEVKALSVLGISYMIKIILVISLIFFVGKNMKKIFVKQEELNPVKYLSFIFIWNMFVIFTTQTRINSDSLIHYRYMIVGMLPLILILVKELSSYSEKWNHFQTICMNGVLLLMTVILIYGNTKNVDSYMMNNDYLVDVKKEVDALEVENVIWINDPESMNKCKGLNDETEYGCFFTDDQSFYNGANSYLDRNSWEYYLDRGDTIILCYATTTPFDYIAREEIASQFEYVSTVRYFDIYRKK